MAGNRRQTLILLLSFLVAGSAFALNNRSAVSVHGSDSASCTPLAPCRSFNVAIAATVAGGDVVALDSAGYGAFTVDKDMSIIAAPGVLAGITASVGNAVTITGSGPAVVLRNLAIIGVGGTTGINDTSSRKLYVEGCTISGFAGDGLLYTNSTNWSGGNLVDISNSTIRDNAGGVHIVAGGTFYVHTEIDNTTLAGNSIGVNIGGLGFNRTTVFRSRMILNSDAGLYQNPGGQASSLTTVESCVVAGNEDGIESNANSGPSTVRLSNTTVTGNEGYGLRLWNGGSIYSRGNNTVEDNFTNGGFNGSYSAK